MSYRGQSLLGSAGLIFSTLLVGKQPALLKRRPGGCSVLPVNRNLLDLDINTYFKQIREYGGIATL